MLRGFFTVLLVGTVCAGFAQLAVPSAGGGVATAMGSLDFTLGQVAYTTAMTGDNSIQLGVQQAYPPVDSRVEPHDALAGVVLYPNPARNFARIDCTACAAGVHIALYDATGRLAMELQAQSSSIPISLEHMASGLYTIELTLSDRRQMRLRLIVQS